ncbi:hypothetical protein GYH30_031817 [Glycine max]|nr:hypothetical protein GYH30_031817 [Glycine max]
MNNIFRGSRYRIVTVAPLLIMLQLQQLRSELGDSGDDSVPGNVLERVLEASADLHKIVPDSDQSLRGGEITGGGGGRRRRRRRRRKRRGRGRRRRQSEGVGDTAKNMRYVVLDAMAIDGGLRRRRRVDNGAVVEIIRFWVGVVGLEELRHFSFNFKDLAAWAWSKVARSEEVRVERERSVWKLLGHEGAKKENKKVSKTQRRFY